MVGLSLAVWIQHSLVAISLRKRGRIEKAAGAHTATGISISIHGIQATGAEPQGLQGHPHEPGPSLTWALRQGRVPEHFAFKMEISAL